MCCGLCGWFIKLTTFHDVRYDGEVIMLFDDAGRLMKNYQAILYRGTPEIVKKSGGLHQKRINDVESLVINPSNLSDLVTAKDYGWYVKDCIMKEIGASIFTDWKIVFVAGEFPQKTLSDEYYVVSSIKLPMFLANKNSVHLVPLLETLIHIDQKWSGMTLCQIACSIAGRFEVQFNDQLKLMSYLFNRYRDTLVSLCRVENTPLNKLYQSEFNITFQHNHTKLPTISNIRVVKRLENVVMLPLSRLICERTYGNIPWLIASGRDRDDIERKAKFISHPFGFFENAIHYNEMKESVLFKNVCILPQMFIKEPIQNEDGSENSITHTYSVGAIIGIVVFEDGSRDTVLRGELFDNITTKEQLILTFMFNAFVGGHLTESTNCASILRNLKLYEDQINVRRWFIEAIQQILFSVS